MKDESNGPQSSMQSPCWSLQDNVKVPQGLLGGFGPELTPVFRLHPLGHCCILCIGRVSDEVVFAWFAAAWCRQCAPTLQHTWP